MRKTRHAALSLFVVGAILAAGPVAFAATYQVGAGKPYASLAEVAPQLAPGDLVEVDGDASYGGDVVLTQSGTSSQKITIRGVRVNGKRPTLSGGTNTIEVYADHYVIEGLELTGGAFRCFFHHGDDVTLRDSLIHDCPGHGLLGADSESGSLTMDYVEVHHAGAGDTKHQIYMATDEETHPGSVFRMQHCFVHDGNGGNNVKTRAERNEIYYNWIEGALYHELELIGPDGQDPALAREDSDVVGNVFRKTGTSFVTRVGGDGTGDTSGRYRFVNNTFILVPGSSSVFRFFDQIESIEMHNNVFFREGGGGVKMTQDSDAAWTTGAAVIAGSDNWVQDGSTAVPAEWTGTIGGQDPGFVDLPGDDLIPTAAAPIVDKGSGATSSAPGHEFPAALTLPLYMPPPGAIEAVDAAAPRPNVGAIDVGAYEYGSGPPNTTGSGGSTGTGATTGAGATSGAGGKPGTGPGSGAGSGDGGDGFLNSETPEERVGDVEPVSCGCEVAGAPRSTRALLLLLGASLLLVSRRRRRG